MVYVHDEKAEELIILIGSVVETSTAKGQKLVKEKQK